MDVVAGAIGHSARTAEACQRLRKNFGNLAVHAEALRIASGTFIYGSRIIGKAPPCLLRDGSSLSVAVGHLVDKTELSRQLDVSSGSSISYLLGEAWLRWGARIGGRVVGDWALAVWNPALQRLALVRSAASSYPLFFTEGEEGPEFASLAQALARSKSVRPSPDWAAIANFMNHMVLPDNHTAFAGVRRVPAGHAVLREDGQWSDEAIWTPRLLADPEPRDWTSEYRQALENSVSDLLPPSGKIASQLSGGRDSSAVTAVASIMAPGRVTAITFAPRPGSVPLAAERLIFDESQQARSTARALGIPHVQVDGGSVDDQLSWLRKLQSLAFLPLISASGAGLRMSVSAAAANLDAEVMLAGAFGNLGLSSGGIQYLSDLRAEGGLAAWLRMANRVAALHGWKTVLHQSAPVRLRQRLREFRENRFLSIPSMWTGPLAAGLSERKSQASSARTAREELFLVIKETEVADFCPDAFHFVRLLDPTTDRRIVELCLRVPARLLVDETLGRPLYEAAFADVLPSVLLRERRRGRQAADWWTAFDPDLVRSVLEESSGHPLVKEAINVAAAEPLLQSWPQSFDEAFRREAEFQELLGSLSIALFLVENF